MLNVSLRYPTSPSDTRTGDMNVEIAGRHLIGCANQLADRPHKPVGNGNAEPDCRQHDDQRQSQVGQRERDLRGSSVGLKAAILVGVCPHDLPRLDDLRIDQPDSEEIGVFELPELDDRADDVAGAWLDHHRLAVRRVLHGAGGRLRHGEIGLGLGAHDERAVRRNQRGMGELPPFRLSAQEVEKAVAVQIVDLPIVVERLGHGQRRVEKCPGIFLNIGFGDIERIVDDRLGADLEPAVETDVERDRGDDRHHDGRYRRHQREHRDDPHMQARCRLGALPRLENAVRFAPDQSDQNQDEGGVDPCQAPTWFVASARSASPRPEWRTRRPR